MWHDNDWIWSNWKDQKLNLLTWEKKKTSISKRVAGLITVSGAFLYDLISVSKQDLLVQNVKGGNSEKDRCRCNVSLL